MAHFLIDSQSRHALERAVERCKVSAERAREILVELENVVTGQAPGDWRFTASPTAKFIIAYEPDGPDCRFVGRTYRDREGKAVQLVKRLSAGTVSADELKQIRDAYRELLTDPNCEIIHELKTCYDRSKDLSDEKRLFEKTKEWLPHVVPVEARRMGKRPNSIVTGGELWVRQGEFLDLAQGRAGNIEESLLFERLTPEGVDKSRARVYAINGQGRLRLDAEERRACGRIPAVKHRPGERSQGYWTVPTYLDAMYIDMQYAREQWNGDGVYQLTAGSTLLLARLEALFRPFRPQTE